MKNSYFFFTKEKGTEAVFESDKEAIAHAKTIQGVIKIVASKGSRIIKEDEPSTQPPAKPTGSGKK